MEITNVNIIRILPYQNDITSCHDAYRQFETAYTEVQAIIHVRNNDVAPFTIEVKIKGRPSAKQSVDFIENLLLELH
jgi:hypothetical protein